MTVTDAGMQRLMRAIAAARPHQPIDSDVIAFWKHRLTANRVTDTDAFTAVEELADQPDRYDIPLGAVIERARINRDRRQQLERFRELGAGDDPRRAGVLPPGVHGWCDKCTSALLGYDSETTCRNCDPSYRRNPTRAKERTT